MYLVWIALSLIFVGCTPPVYQKTLAGIDEFTADSCEISQGKISILEMENQSPDYYSNMTNCFDEMVLEGDELTIALYHPSRPDRVQALQMINNTTGFRICDGKIALPNLGLFDVEGLNLKEIQDKLQAAYCQDLSSGKIFINFKKRRERYVQIIGASKTIVAVNGKTRLSEVLAKAKIHPTSNLFKSYVMRNDQQLPLDLYKLIHLGDETQNIVMQGGDQIFIASTSDASILVTGEIEHPIVIPTIYGFISLREALALAGGIPFTGNKEYILVIRGNFKRPKAYGLKWNDLSHLSNQSLLLIPGDVIVISEKPITQWNRFIDQLQPSVDNMQTSYNLYRLMKGMR